MYIPNITRLLLHLVVDWRILVFFKPCFYVGSWTFLRNKLAGEYLHPVFRYIHQVTLAEGDFSLHLEAETVITYPVSLDS